MTKDMMAFMNATTDAEDQQDETVRCINEILRRKEHLLETIEKIKKELQETDEVLEHMEDLDNNKSTTTIKEIIAGKKCFNKSPKKGIAYMIETNVVENTSSSIAKFLYKNSDKGVSKTAIGDYLGEPDDFNIQVLNDFVHVHDLASKSLDEALRMFLWSFRLPGEAQKIDRMMEAFAAWYVECNAGIFACRDACYVLSFATIMLNTSLHNPSVREKPTKEQFLTMNRGIDKDEDNNDKDIDSHILLAIYDSIKKHPFKVPEEDMEASHFFNPDKEGWLMKQGGNRYKTWKRRWFILDDKCLYYFEYTHDKEPKGIIPLENLQVREVSDTKKPNCFEIFLPNDAQTDSIKIAKTDADGKIFDGTKHTCYRFSAPTGIEKSQWISNIRKSISMDPYYDMIAARKKNSENNKHI